MAFRYVEMGSTVAADPARAAAELAARMRACGSNMGEVAASYGVHRETLAGWFDKLEAAGHPVAGRGAAKKGRKPGRKERAGEREQPEPAAAPRGRVRRGSPQLSG